MEKNTGKVRKICQSKNVRTMETIANANSNAHLNKNNCNIKNYMLFLMRFEFEALNNFTKAVDNFVLHGTGHMVHG